MKNRKKSFVGWIYGDDDYNFQPISAWSDSPLGVYFCVLKHKKDLGNFGGIKVRITLEELKNEK